MRVRLLMTMKARVPGGGSVIIPAGIYNDEDPNFPEALRGESRPGVVVKLDEAPASVPGPSENDNSGSEDPDDEDNSSIGEEEGVEEEEEGVEEEEEEVVKEKKVEKKSSTKKDKIKRRG